MYFTILTNHFTGTLWKDNFSVIVLFGAGLKYGSYANIVPLAKVATPPPDGLPIRERQMIRRKAMAL
jgi:hypothetical protein